MRRQPPIHAPRPISPVSPTTVRVVRGDAGDRAVLLDRSSDGAELEIGLGTPLEAVIGTACVIGWSAWVVPTQEMFVSTQTTMALLGSSSFESTASPFRVPGPTADGDWTLRLTTAYEADSDSTIWSVTFFRVVVGGAPYKTPAPPTPRPTPVPTPAITPAVACVTPVEAGGPPGATIIVPGQDPLVGTIGASTWFDVVTDPSRLELTEGPTIPYEGTLQVHISGDYCATRWSIAAMPFPEPETTLTETDFSGTAEWQSFTANLHDNPIIAQQNRLEAIPVGLGRILVRAMFNFEGGHRVQVYWLLRISAFPTPPIRVVAPDGTAVTPVVGCGVSVGTNENWYGEECGDGSWPLLENGPTLAVQDGDIIEVHSDAWDLAYWNIRWAHHADVRDCCDPEDIGNLGGYNSQDRTRIRWIVPPPGDYTVQLYLSHDETGPEYRQYGLPLFLRVRVLP